MRGATVIACHAGLHKYASSSRTTNAGNPLEEGVYGLPMAQSKGCLVAGTPHGTVTTKSMGATKGDPNWDYIRTELSGRVTTLFRDQGMCPGTGHRSFQEYDELPLPHWFALLYQPTASQMVGVKEKLH